MHHRSRYSLVVFSFLLLTALVLVSVPKGAWRPWSPGIDDAAICPRQLVPEGFGYSR